MSTPIAPMSRMIKSNYIIDTYSNLLHSDQSQLDLNPELNDDSLLVNQKSSPSNYDKEIKKCQKKLEQILCPRKNLKGREEERDREGRENSDMMYQFYRMMKRNKELESQLELERVAHQNTKRKMGGVIQGQQQEIEVLKRAIFETNGSQMEG